MKKTINIKIIIFQIISFVLLLLLTSQISTVFAGQVSGSLRGKVVEIINSAGYTYVLIENGGKQIWVAFPQTNIMKGSTIAFKPGMELKNFESKSLRRKFDSIIFSDGVVEGSSKVVGNGTSTDVETTYSGSRLIGLYNIMADQDKKWCSPTAPFNAKIVGLQYGNNGEGLNVAGLTIEDNNGRSSIIIDSDRVFNSLSMADQRNLRSLFSKGNKIKTKAFLCGTGGFIYADSIELIRN